MPRRSAAAEAALRREGRIQESRRPAVGEGDPAGAPPGTQGRAMVNHALLATLHGRRQRIFSALSSARDRPRHRLSLRHSSIRPTRAAL